MKKLYTLALAAICALGAAAAPKSQSVGKYVAKNVLLTSEVKTASVKTSKKAPAKAAAIDKLEDASTWNYYGLLTGASGAQSKPVAISIDDADAGKVAVMLATNIILEATYDAKSGELTIAKQYIGKDDDGDIYFYIKDLDEDGYTLDGESATKTAAVGTFDGTSVTFDPLEVWAVGDPNNEEVGWYVLSAENEFTSVEPEPEPELIDLGTGKFLENLVYPVFTGEENTVCDVVVKTDGAGTYYIIDPLKNLYTKKGINAVSPQLVIDATDPDNILIPITGTGIGNVEAPYTYFSESYYAKITNTELEEDLYITKTVEGNTVTITIPYHATTLWLYGTQDGYYYGSLYESTLTFTEESSGVDNVAADNADAPVEYYNLLGNRVNNPAKGQIIIKKQGSTVTKMVVR